MTPTHQDGGEKALPCPFCGGEAYFESQETSKDFLQWASVSCHRCTVSMPRRTSEEALAAWNTRALPALDNRKGV